MIGNNTIYARIGSLQSRNEIFSKTHQELNYIVQPVSGSEIISREAYGSHEAYINLAVNAKGVRPNS